MPRNFVHVDILWTRSWQLDHPKQRANKCLHGRTDHHRRVADHLRKTRGYPSGVKTPFFDWLDNTVNSCWLAAPADLTIDRRGVRLRHAPDNAEDLLPGDDWESRDSEYLVPGLAAN